jgi:hypothetical protein
MPSDKQPARGPAEFYRRLLKDLTPETISVALAAITAGDIRAMLLDRRELGAAFGTSPTEASAFCKRIGVPTIRLGHRGVFVSKLDLIMALHGGDLERLRPSMEAVGMPRWVLIGPSQPPRKRGEK